MNTRSSRRRTGSPPTASRAGLRARIPSGPLALEPLVSICSVFPWTPSSQEMEPPENPVRFNHHLGHRVGANPEGLVQGGRRRPGDGVECLVVRGDLDRERAPARCQRPERVLHGRGRVDDVARPEGGAAVDELSVGERPERFTQRVGCVHDERLECDDRRTAGLHSRIAGDLDLADHFCRPIGALWNGGRDSGKYRPRGGLGIERVVLAVVTSLAPIAVVDLDHAEPLAPDEAREADAVGTGAFDSECFDVAELTSPVQQRCVTGPIRGRPDRCRQDTKSVEAGVRPSCIPSFCKHQITPKTSRYTRCSMSMFPNASINGRIRSSGQLGRWWYSISPWRNNECVRRFTVFAFNQRS